MTEDEDRKYYKGVGKFFGYPECCSDWFAKRMAGEVLFVLTPAQQDVEDGGGFIPCPSCAKKLKEEQSKPQTLIENRICNAKYPFEDGKQFVHYVEDQGL